jgi:hypothetical protein
VLLWSALPEFSLAVVAQCRFHVVNQKIAATAISPPLFASDTSARVKPEDPLQYWHCEFQIVSHVIWAHRKLADVVQQLVDCFNALR